MILSGLQEGVPSSAPQCGRWSWPRRAAVRVLWQSFHLWNSSVFIVLGRVIGNIMTVHSNHKTQERLFLKRNSGTLLLLTIKGFLLMACGGFSQFRSEHLLCITEGLPSVQLYLSLISASIGLCQQALSWSGTQHRVLPQIPSQPRK